jgi:hypothetical protein
MRDAWDGPHEDDIGPELPPVHDPAPPDIEDIEQWSKGGASYGDTGDKLESESPEDAGYERLPDERDGRGDEPSPDDVAKVDRLFDWPEADGEEQPSGEQVAGWARDLFAGLDNAVDDGGTWEAPAADAREAVRDAPAQAVKFLSSVDTTAVFREAPEVTDADVEAVVKAMRHAVQKVGLGKVLAIVAQLADNPENLETLLRIADTSKAPTRVKDLIKRFSSKPLLYSGAALMCAAGINIALLRNPTAETALTNETAIAALIAAVAALFKRSP